MGLTVSEKSVFPTSFGRGRFQGNLFPLHMYIFPTATLEEAHRSFLLRIHIGRDE